MRGTPPVSPQSIRKEMDSKMKRHFWMRLLTLLLGMGCGAIAQPQWTWQNPKLQGNTLNAVVWTGERLVAVGDAGTIMTSPEGENWTVQPSGTVDNLSALVWTGTQLLAVGQRGRILTSPDGITWKARNSGTQSNFSSVAWSGMQFMAIGGDGLYAVSVDDKVWSLRQFAEGIVMNSVAWTGNKWVAVGRRGYDSSVILTSTDASKWQAAGWRTQVEMDEHESYELGYVTQSGGKTLVTAKDAAEILVSDSGRSWYSVGSRFTRNLNGLQFNGTEWLGVGTYGTIVQSTNGIRWQKVDSLGESESRAGPEFKSIAWTGSRWIVVGEEGAIYSSSDGKAWTAQTRGGGGWISSIAWTGKQFVVLGDSIGRSFDAGHWTFSARPKGMEATHLTWTGTQLVAVGNGMYSSDDGIKWTRRAASSKALYFVKWTGNQLVAVGAKGTIFTSPDGQKWSRRESGTRLDLNSVTWTGSELVAVGGNGAGEGCVILASPDGVTWTTRYRGDTYLQSIVWTGTRLLAGGGKMMSSEDGINWTPVIDSPYNPDGGYIPDGTGRKVAIVKLARAGGIVVGIGTFWWSNELFASADGKTWRPFLKISGDIGAALWTGARFVVVGGGGEILTSP